MYIFVVKICFDSSYLTLNNAFFFIVTVNGWTAKFKAISVQYVDIYETILMYPF